MSGLLNYILPQRKHGQKVLNSLEQESRFDKGLKCKTDFKIFILTENKKVSTRCLLIQQCQSF